MPDENVEILIRTQADTGGAQRAAESLGKVEAAAGKTTNASKQLKDAFRGLSLQFPLLAQAANMMVNPITASVLAIAGAFALWKRRVDELTRTFANSELPQVNTADLARVNEAAAAWKALGDSVSQAAAAFRSVNAESGRVTDQIKQQVQLQKEQLTQEKAMALARLEAQRGSMGAGEYATARQGIEDRYAAAGIAAEQSGARQTLAEKYRRQANLIIQARQQMGEAGGIRIGSAQDDDVIEREMAKQAEVAAKEISERRDNQGMLADMRGSWWERLKNAPKYYMRYGLGLNNDEAYALEEQNIGTAQVAIDRYNSFRESRAGRDALRSRRGSLVSGAGAAAGEAMGLEMSLPGERAAMEARFASQNAGLVSESTSGLAGALTATNQQRAQLSQQVIQAIEAGSRIDSSFSNQLLRLTAIIESLQARIAQQESRFANLRNK